VLSVGVRAERKLDVVGAPKSAAVRRFRHECPVCDFVRFARRRVQSWRCGDCMRAGLDGQLLITEENP
jgi:ribosomal protein L37AE/L43A